MKDIGRTIEGNYIVEMSETEYAHFSILCRAVEGKSLSNIYSPKPFDFQSGFDFTKTFDAIKAFYELHFRVTELNETVNEIRRSLNNVEQ